MFGTGARFAEYGITGGFFILSQLLVLGWAIPGGVGAAFQFSTALLADLNHPELAPFFPAILSLFVALALLSLFITGLLLDLTRAFSWVWEMRRFRDQLIRNRKWIVQLIEAELPDCKRDYVCCLTLLDGLSSPRLWRARFKLPAFWSASARRRRLRFLIGLMRRIQQAFRRMRRIQQAFRRLEAALVAKVVVAGIRTDSLSEQMSISRMSRAITLAIWLSGLEFYVASLYRLSRGDINSFSSLELRIVVAVAVAFAILFAVVIGRAAYSRFCLMLFSQVYAISKHSKPD